jgi:hypothetical protein
MAKKKVAFKLELDTSEAMEGVEKTTESVEDLGKQTKKTSGEMKGGFKAAEQGTKKLGTSVGGLIKALGIIGVAMAVFSFMKDILSKNQKIMDALSTATIALEIIINKLFSAVAPLGDAMKSAFEDPKQSLIELKDFIKDRFMVFIKGFGDQFIALGGIIESALKLDWDAVKKNTKDLGEALVQTFTLTTKEERSAIAESMREFANEVKDATLAAVDQADALTKLRNEVELLEAGQKKIQMTYQRDAELQRQRRDDIRLTLAERIEANDKLGTILEDQIKEEQVLADKRLALAIRERDELGATTERKAAVLIAEGELADLKERIKSQESEQLTNQAALEKELFDLQQELRVATLEEREKELEELEIYYDRLDEIARLASDTSVDLVAARNEAIDELNEKHRSEDLAKDKAAKAKLKAAEKKLADDKIAVAQSLGNVLGGIAAAIEGESKAAVAARKVLAVAQIAIDTATAIVGAISQAQSVPYPGNLVAIATGVAAVVAGIASATTTLNTANVPGPSAPPPPPPPSLSAPSPNFSGISTNTTELGNTEQAELMPIQAFVVETGITGSQENVNQIEGQATFG